MLLARKNKNKIYKHLYFLGGFICISIVFGVLALHHPAIAQSGDQAAQQAAALAGLDNEPSGEISQFFRWLLYGVLQLIILLISVAANLFKFATDPAFISGDTGLLNLDEVYTLWQFIRDFFNLFFIFLLLLFAFARIFQISRFSSFDVFKGIIGAAFLINFSFPITRLIIDAGNVPMYFFAQSLVGSNFDSVFAGFFGGSKLGDILTPGGGQDASFFALLAAIVFSFMLMISLFILAILFLIRLLTLVVLLIFSPVGIAASMVPGLKTYAKKWWDTLFKNVLFGPMAMLLLVVSVRFLTEINSSTLAQNYATQQQSVSAGLDQLGLAAYSIFFIPVILLWMAITMGFKGSVYGSSYVVGKGVGAMSWTRKKVTGGAKWAGGRAVSPVTTRAKGAGEGLKKRAYEGRLFGSRVKNLTGGRLGAKAWKEASEETEANYRGLADRGRSGRRSEMSKLDSKRVAEQRKEYKDGNYADTELDRILKTGSDTEKKAAALEMADRKDRLNTSERVADALVAVADDKERFDKVLGAATSQGIKLNPEQIDHIIKARAGSFVYDPKKTDDNGNVLSEAEQKNKFDFGIKEDLKDKMVKEGRANYIVDYEKSKGSNMGKVFKDYELLKLKTPDLIRQKKLLNNPEFQTTFALSTSKDRVTKLVDKAMEDGSSEIDGAVQKIKTMNQNKVQSASALVNNQRQQNRSNQGAGTP